MSLAVAPHKGDGNEGDGGDDVKEPLLTLKHAPGSASVLQMRQADDTGDDGDRRADGDVSDDPSFDCNVEAERQDSYEQV